MSSDQRPLSRCGTKKPECVSNRGDLRSRVWSHLVQQTAGPAAPCSSPSNLFQCRCKPFVFHQDVFCVTFHFIVICLLHPPCWNLWWVIVSRQYDVIPLAPANSVATGPPKFSCERCSLWEITRLESYNQKCCWFSEVEFWRCVNATAAVSEKQELLKVPTPHVAGMERSHGDAVFSLSCRGCMEQFLGPGFWPGIPVLLKGGSCRHLRWCLYLQYLSSFCNRLLRFWSFKGLALILSSSKRLQSKTIDQVLEQNY